MADVTTDQLMIFDTASLYFRAFFGVPSSVVAPDGSPVNAVRGLLDAMARLVEQYSPTDLACAWDNDWRPTWRVDLVPSYKAHRVEQADAGTTVVGAGGVGAVSGQAEEAPAGLEAQVPVILEVLAALGVPVIGVDDHEADDVLGTLATTSPCPTLVVTGDRDLFQLAHGTTRVVYVGRGVAKHDLVDSAWVRERYGIDAEQYVDFAVLRGDPSDGLPGVKGIGDRSAASLLQTHGSLEQIVAAVADPDAAMSGSLRSKIAAAVDYLGPATEVVRVVTDLEIEPFTSRITDWKVDEDALAALDERWGLGSSLARFRTACGL
ncbi:5'-3' exonuclease [Aestuariimicrobium ganziense]|uniref:5'-3' exonuclease n=1 Tax=Aestuariimicrobium ganziense TaxID=2773677 RepID=UPI001F2A4010|nr:5'-3' exonuclease [Aestuariimicrobium ganziense]